MFIPDGQLSTDSVQQLIERLASKFYSPYTGLLKCGNLKCNISLFPAPEPYQKYSIDPVTFILLLTTFISVNLNFPLKCFCIYLIYMASMSEL